MSTEVQQADDLGSIVTSRYCENALISEFMPPEGTWSILAKMGWTTHEGTASVHSVKPQANEQHQSASHFI